MTAVIIGNSSFGAQPPPFGQLTNSAVAALHRANAAILRLQQAVEAAASGYTGAPGTEYEGPTTNFGVVPDPDNPGQRGQDYAYAIGVLQEQWTSFWAAASQAIETIDNGATLPG